MKKIIVVGTTGSGKSTLCKKLQGKFKYPYIQLDQLYWKPNWVGSSDDEFLPKIQTIIEDNENWIIDGNYNRTMNITWPRADTVVWIDYPFWLVFYQNLSRAIKRSLTNEELWPNTGNKESLLRLFSKDSILKWLIKTYPVMKERYASAMTDQSNSHIKFYRLKTRKEVKQFINTIDL